MIKGTSDFINPMTWSMIGSSARIPLLVIPPFSTFSSEKMIEIVVETNTWFQKTALTALTVKMWKISSIQKNL